MQLRYLYIILLIFVLTSCSISFYREKALESIGFSDALGNDAITSSDDADAGNLRIESSIAYDYISDFNDGFGMLNKDGQWILIDKEYNAIFSTSEYEVINIYEDILCVKYFENSQYGLIDVSGNIVATPKYDAPISFSEGLAMAQRDGRIGYLDVEGQEVIEFDYIWGCRFSDSLAAVGVDENHYYFINAKGERVSGPFEDLGAEVYNHTLAYLEYSEGYTAFFEENPKDSAVPYGGGYGSWGFLDKQGNVAIEPEYLFVRPFREGLAAVETKEEKWIYINKNGEKVLDGGPGDFYNGLVCIGDQFIDKLGNTVIQIPEDYSVAFSMQKGFDNFYFGDYMVVYNELENYYAIMNKQGEIILGLNDYQEMKIWNENKVAVKKDGKWCIVYIDDKMLAFSENT